MKDIVLNQHAILIDTEQEEIKPALLILPGGGYFALTDNEGIPVAQEFGKRGFHTFVLRYSTLETNPENCCFEQAMEDLLQAVEYLRLHADSLHLNGNIFLLGFSAGGHLAAMYGNSWRDLARQRHMKAAILMIDGIVLGYPALNFSLISDQHLNGVPMEHRKRAEQFRCAVLMGLLHQKEMDRTKLDKLDACNSINLDTPATFVWGTLKDEIIRPSTLTKYAERMISTGRECELHLYEGGTHGMSLATQSTANNQNMINQRISSWAGLAEGWMKEKMK